MKTSDMLSESLDHVVDIAMLGSEAGKVCNEGVISMNDENVCAGAFSIRVFDSSCVRSTPLQLLGEGDASNETQRCGDCCADGKGDGLVRDAGSKMEPCASLTPRSAKASPPPW